jgi:hypothetical protein
MFTMVRCIFEAGKVLDDRTVENSQGLGASNVHTYYLAVSASSICFLIFLIPSHCAVRVAIAMEMQRLSKKLQKLRRLDCNSQSCDKAMNIHANIIGREKLHTTLVIPTILIECDGEAADFFLDVLASCLGTLFLNQMGYHARNSRAVNSSREVNTDRHISA